MIQVIAKYGTEIANQLAFFESLKSNTSIKNEGAIDIINDLKKR
jgi:hypothetical protein